MSQTAEPTVAEPTVAEPAPSESDPPSKQDDERAPAPPPTPKQPAEAPPVGPPPPGFYPVPRAGTGYLHRLSYLLAVAAAFGLAPLTSKLGTTLGAVALVCLGVVLALAASGAVNASAVVGGALGSLSSGLLAAVSPALAGAVLVAMCFAERTLRVRGGFARVVHVALALAGGALAGIVAASYEDAEPSVRVISIVVAAVLAALPLFVDADDPRAHALDDLAEQVPEPTAGLLRRGAGLCRTADESILDRPLLEQVRQSWRKLLQLAHARARLSRSAGPAGAAPALPPAVGSTSATTPTAASCHADAVARHIDQQIAEHVAVLTRAFTAVDTARAAEISLDDSALRNVQTTGESLEQVAEAIVEEI